MFSSFKDKLNTGLTSIQEKGLAAANAATTAAVAAAEAANKAANSGSNSPAQRPSGDHASGSHYSDHPLQDPLNVSQSPGGPGSPQRNSIGGGGSATSLFRRSLQTPRKSADLISFGSSPPPTPQQSSSSSGAGNAGASRKLLTMVRQLTLDPMQEKPDKLQLEQVRSTEPGGAEMTDALVEKLERLQRYEARFPGTI